MNNLHHEPLSLNTKALTLKACIHHCQDTAQTCLETIRYCLEIGGLRCHSEHLKNLMTCSITCRNAVDLMSLHTDLMGPFCALCAEACLKCAESCDDANDDQNLECAQKCRQNAEVCRNMAQSH